MQVATLNVPGLVAAEKRYEVEAWMRRNMVDMVMIQKTHVGGNADIVRKGYTWYHSGGDTRGTIHHGVAIVMRK